MRKLVAAGAGMLALVAFPAPAAAATRHVWIAAVPTIWNVVPNERNAIEGERYTVDKTTMRTVVYERFTRNWKRKLPAQTRIPGPLIKARVGDDIFIHFKNKDTRFKRPHSMHFHGVHYPFGSDGSFIPGFSGAGGDVMPGKTFTYQLHAGADSAGVWPYHDHSPSMMDSIAGGMYGAVSILPQGVPRAKHEFVDVLRVPPRLRDDQRPRVRRQHAGAEVARRRQRAVGRARARRRAPHLPRPRPPLARPRRHARSTPRPSARPSRSRSASRRTGPGRGSITATSSST